jgi:DNA-binding FadR family transcriptional regulator
MANFQIPPDDARDEEYPAARFGRRRSRKTSELIARELANEIIKRDLPEGTTLSPEKDMIERYGVGRTTLREALRLLETRGVLTIRVGPRGGPVVRRPKASDLSDALTLILQFEGASLLDVFQANRAVQPMVASLAATRITDSEISELTSVLDRMKDALDDADELAAQTERFQRVIDNAAGSVTLLVLAEAVRVISYSTIADVAFPAEQGRERCQHFSRLLSALQQHDSGGAEQEVRQYLDATGRHWLHHYRELVNRPVRWTSA